MWFHRKYFYILKHTFSFLAKQSHTLSNVLAIHPLSTVPRRGSRRLQPSEACPSNIHTLLRRQWDPDLHGGGPTARAAHRELRGTLAITSTTYIAHSGHTFCPLLDKISGNGDVIYTLCCLYSTVGQKYLQLQMSPTTHFKNKRNMTFAFIQIRWL